MCIETTLHVYRNDFDLYRNDLYRNDFVSKRPDTLLKYRSRVFPTIFSCGSPLAGLLQPKVEGPEVKVGDTTVSIEQQTRTKIKAVL